MFCREDGAYCAWLGRPGGVAPRGLACRERRLKSAFDRFGGAWPLNGLLRFSFFLLARRDDAQDGFEERVISFGHLFNLQTLKHDAEN